LKSALFLTIPTLYILNPFDLIPDYLVLPGWLDDLLVAFTSSFLARKAVPEQDIVRIQARSVSNARRLAILFILCALLLSITIAGAIALIVFFGINLLGS